MQTIDRNRRKYLGMMASLAAAPSLALSTKRHDELLMRPIPSSGKAIAAVGMGSWLTFDVAPTGKALATRLEVLRTFFDMGGQLIDSSPMYGQSEAVIGQCLQALNSPKQAFTATKVWTSGEHNGIAQMQDSAALWRTKRFDLMQIHNLVDWQTHIKTLLSWKDKGRVGQIGITTYGGLLHTEIEKIMQHYPIDFVQLTYNIRDRKAEEILLPLAHKRKIAVIANRPFQGGSLFNQVGQRRIPDWMKQYSCTNWAQYFLKFILSHPVITCAIPATTQVAHMRQNMAAMQGELPSATDREKMVSYFEEARHY